MQNRALNFLNHACRTKKFILFHLAKLIVFKLYAEIPGSTGKNSVLEENKKSIPVRKECTNVLSFIIVGKICVMSEPMDCYAQIISEFRLMHGKQYLTI
jgi:hypothetical protein